MEEDLKLVLKVDRYRLENKTTIFLACNHFGISQSRYEKAKSRYLGKLIERYQHWRSVNVEKILRERNLNFDDMGDK